MKKKRDFPAEAPFFSFSLDKSYQIRYNKRVATYGEEKPLIQAIENFFLNIVGAKLCVFFCSLLPIIECRGAVPLGCGLGLPWWQTYLLAVAGNLLPVPFILLFIRAVLRWMTGEELATAEGEPDEGTEAPRKKHYCRVKWINRFGRWLERKVDKHKGKIERYSYWGVVLFVAIPIPGTGAWTGSLIAAVLKLDFKKSLLAATFGVFIAAAIMSVISYLIKAVV